MTGGKGRKCGGTETAERGLDWRARPDRCAPGVEPVAGVAARAGPDAGWRRGMSVASRAGSGRSRQAHHRRAEGGLVSA